MRLDDCIELVGRAAFLIRSATLVVGDIHLGEEEALARAGVLVPKTAFADLRKKLLSLIQTTKPRRLIFDGDIKHEFGRISEGEWRQLRRLLDGLHSHCRIEAVQGNHDILLPRMADALKLPLHPWLKIGDILLLHGHKEPPSAALKGVRRIIIAHEHPSVRLSDGIRSETYPCFLWGPWGKKKVLVLPAMSGLHEGSDILSQAPMSPLLARYREFAVFVIDRERILPMRTVGASQNRL